MKAIVILAHPDSDSFNHAIAQTVVETLEEIGNEVIFHDLYAAKFNPVIATEEIRKSGRVPLDAERHCEELKDADGLVFVHPNWWGQPPAILKGWIDRILRPDVAYKFTEGDKGEGIPQGLLKVKSAVVFNTSDTEKNREDNVFGDPLENIWKKCICEFCGVRNFHRSVFRVIVTSTPSQRSTWIEEVKQTIQKHFLNKQ